VDNLKEKSGIELINIDDNSICSNDVKKINIQNLKPPNEYTDKNIKKIAKLLSIPLSYKEKTGSRKYYKSEELYNNIKVILNKKT
jgi:hypothetical protein